MRNGNCSTCIMQGHNSHTYYENDYGLKEYKARNTIRSRDKCEELPHIKLEGSVVQVSETLEATMLDQSHRNDSVVFDEEDQSFEHWANTIKKKSYPTVWRSVISRHGVEITPEEVKKEYWDDNKIDIDKAIKDGVRFPTKTCNVRRLTVIDETVLRYMIKNSKSVTLLSATLSLQQRKLLERITKEVTGEDLVVITIPTAEERKIDCCNIIGTNRHINAKLVKKLIEQEQNNSLGRILVFKPTKNKARKLYNYLERSRIPTGLAERSTKVGVGGPSAFNMFDEMVRQSKVIITHSLGSLGRGINLQMFDTVMVDSTVYKPMSAYGIEDPRKVREVQEEERAITLIQNIGRVMRKRDEECVSTRNVLIGGLQVESELHAIGTELQKVVRSKLADHWVARSTDRKSKKEADTLNGFCGIVKRLLSGQDRNKFHEKWSKRITALAIEGYTWGKIKGKMNYGKKSQVDKDWFDSEGHKVYERSRK